MARGKGKGLISFTKEAALSNKEAGQSIELLIAISAESRQGKGRETLPDYTEILCNTLSRQAPPQTRTTRRLFAFTFRSIPSGFD